MQDQDTISGSSNQTKREPRLKLRSGTIALFGLGTAVYLLSLDLPWVREYVINRANQHPVTGVGLWVLLALFTVVLTWNFMRTHAYNRRGLRVGGVAAVGLAWAGWLTWLTNDRFNNSDVFSHMGVFWNVMLVGVIAVVLLMPVIYFEWVRGWFDDRRESAKRRVRKSAI